MKLTDKLKELATNTKKVVTPKHPNKNITVIDQYGKVKTVPSTWDMTS